MSAPEQAIELQCTCGKSCTLPLESTAAATDIPCPVCGRTVYWHVCGTCETGWSDNNPDSVCPECAPAYRPSFWARLGIVSKPCPHCGNALSSFLLLLGNVHGRVTCPSCRKRAEIVGSGMPVFAAIFGCLILLALAADRLHVRFDSPLTTILAIPVMFWCCIEAGAAAVMIAKARAG